MKLRLILGVMLLVGFAAGTDLGTVGTEAQTKSTLVDVDKAKALGSPNAPVTMEVFSDFQCPACKAYYETVWRRLIDNYVNTGKVYLVHRDFPLPAHAYSRIAANYANAAARIGKYTAVERALFEAQEAWSVSGDVDGTVAKALTPKEMIKVRALVKADALKAGIDKDVERGHLFNVSQTPTTIFHSQGQTFPYGGQVNYDILRQFLDQLIGQR
ncbi:MAG: DsbA family protein [Acidobacteriia bacterium]|nr:DsbA family protein [Terriglobia bacterium]